MISLIECCGRKPPALPIPTIMVLAPAAFAASIVRSGTPQFALHPGRRSWPKHHFGRQSTIPCAVLAASWSGTSPRNRRYGVGISIASGRLPTDHPVGGPVSSMQTTAGLAEQQVDLAAFESRQASTMSSPRGPSETVSSRRSNNRTKASRRPRTGRSRSRPAGHFLEHLVATPEIEVVGVDMAFARRILAFELGWRGAIQSLDQIAGGGIELGNQRFGFTRRGLVAAVRPTRQCRHEIRRAFLGRTANWPSTGRPLTAVRDFSSQARCDDFGICDFRAILLQLLELPRRCSRPCLVRCRAPARAAVHGSPV